MRVSNQSVKAVLGSLLCASTLLLSGQASAGCEPGTDIPDTAKNYLFANPDVWLDRTVLLDEGDMSTVMAEAAALCGNLLLRDRVYGFSNTTTDKLVFSVEVPPGQAGSYRPFLVFTDPFGVYDEIGEVTPGNVFKVTGPGGSPSVYIEAEPVPFEFVDAKAKISTQRPYTEGYILLSEGVNEIEVVLDTISAEQMVFGALSTASSPRGIAISSLELLKESDESAFLAQARKVPGEMEWISEPGRWGVFVHYSSLYTRTFQSGTHTDGTSYGVDELVHQDWERFIDDFDVVSFVDKIEEMGADYVVFTIFHGLGYFPGPSPVIDSMIQGRTTQRDLIKEIGLELESRDKRLALYFHNGKDDDEFMSAMGYYNHDDIQLYNRNLIALQEEWAKRYNGTNGYPKLLSTALYFDAIWSSHPPARRDFPWKEYIDTVKAPDALPDSIIGLTTSRTGPPSPLSDIHVTDAARSSKVKDLDFYDTALSRRNDMMLGIGPAFPFRFEDEWSRRWSGGNEWDDYDLIHEDEYLVTAVAHVTGMNGPVFINAIPTGDVREDVPFFMPDTVAQASRVSADLRSFQLQHTIDNSQYKDLTYDGEWEIETRADAFLSSNQTTNMLGAYVQAEFEGPSIAVYMRENGEAGAFRVRIDGEDMGIVTMPSRTSDGPVKVFETHELSDGPHEITLTSRSNAKLSFDYLSTEVSNVVVGAKGTTIDDASGAIRYQGSGWEHFDNKVDSLDKTVSVTRTPGDRAEYTFSGNSLRVFTENGPGGGIIDVYLDGQRIASVDTYAEQKAYRVKLVDVGQLADGYHTVSLVCTGLKNPDSRSNWCHLDRINTHIPSKQDLTSIDDRGFGELSYTGSWEHNAVKSAENGTMSRTLEAGAGVQLTFNGSDVAIIGRKGPTDGIVDMYIDDMRIATFDAYSSEAKTRVVYHRAQGLTEGEHTLRVVCSGEKNRSARKGYCHLDEIEVR